MRDAPSVPIVGRLVEAGAHVRVFDPVGMAAARPMLPPEVAYCGAALEAAQGADALVVVTEWGEFRALSPAALARAMAGRVVVDLRNVFDPQALRAAGFEYTGIGRR